MQINDLQREHKNKEKRRIGRGGKRGTYSGKGIKGQSSRAGRKFQPITKEFIKRFHKLRGYRNIARTYDLAEVNLNTIEKHYIDGEVVNRITLQEKSIIENPEKIKILGNGELTKKLTFECQVSKGAEEKIKKAGGKYELVK